MLIIIRNFLNSDLDCLGVFYCISFSLFSLGLPDVGAGVLQLCKLSNDVFDY